MYKVVNMRNYRFGALKNIMYIGFGILDMSNNTFVSYDGFEPYVIDKKYIMQSVVDADWPATMKRVAF